MVIAVIRVVIWGTGKTATRFLKHYAQVFNRYCEIVCLVDNDTTRVGTTYLGYLVKGFGEIVSSQYDYLVIMNGAVTEITEQIKRENPNIYNQGKVLDCNLFFQLIMSLPDNGFSRNKVLFFGEKITYEYVKFRAEKTFSKCTFCSRDNGMVVGNKYDYIFICPPRLSSFVEQEEYAECCNKYILKGKAVVKNFEEWVWFFSFDRVLFGGKGNPDKQFFVIGVSDPIRGWGNLLVRFLGGLSYAKRKGMIPVIDMQNISNPYLPEQLITRHNAWEDYFCPVSGYSVEDVYKNKNVILSGIDTHQEEAIDFSDIRYVAEVEAFIQYNIDKLFAKVYGKILGVIYRGTDYNIAYGHPKPWEIEDYIGCVKQYMKETECEFIFLATEVEEALQAFKRALGSKVIYTEQKRFPQHERRLLATIKFDRENDEYLKGLEYLLVLEALLHCNSLIGPDSGTLYFARLAKKDGYEYLHIIE